jgi:hypothetical protein
VEGELFALVGDEVTRRGHQVSGARRQPAQEGSVVIPSHIIGINPRSVNDTIVHA